MSDNETQADIAREMRTYFQTQKRNGNPEHRPWHQVLSDWADRIDAAAERELSSAADDAASKATLDRTAKDAAEYLAYAMAHNPAPQPGSATMRHALERILDIEGYGAPWIVAKSIAQKALEGQQCTPPDQERPDIEQHGNAAALRKALEIFVHDFASFREDVEHGRLHMMQCMDFVKGFIPLLESALAAPPRNCDLCEDWLALYVNFRPPKGMREMPPEWVDAVAAFCKWLKAEGKEASNG